MDIVVVGAGRMGLTHLRGLRAADARIHVIDPREEADRDVEAAIGTDSRAIVTMQRSLQGSIEKADLAILAETAEGRLERFAALVEKGARRILVEKPVEQSRQRVRELALLAQEYDVDVRVNFGFRTLPLYADTREIGGPFRVTVTGGAFGLACNGIHFIDIAAFLAGARSGSVLFADVRPEPIESPRGPQFRDYGGEALIELDDGSRLSLHSSAHTAAPLVATIEQPLRTTIVDLSSDTGIEYRREPRSQQPIYRYGLDYERTVRNDVHRYDLSDLTARWLAGATDLPTVEEALLAHELLFDVLETTGDELFAIT